jgi:hypothetical protein
MNINVVNLAAVTRQPNFDDRVRGLMRAAFDAEDMPLCSVCDRALLGDHGARLECAKKLIEAGGAS